MQRVARALSVLYFIDNIWILFFLRVAVGQDFLTPTFTYTHSILIF